LSDLADYRKIHGHCNVPRATAKTQLAGWVTTKGEYRLPSRWGTYEPDPGGGKPGFRWRSAAPPGRPLERELADYHINMGTAMFLSCENAKLAGWVTKHPKEEKYRFTGKRKRS
jgi:hypothetical protein